MLAGRLNRNWCAVYVQTPSEEPTTIDSQTQRVLSGTLTLAKQMGATVFTYKGEDIADTILRFAREYRVGHVVIGSPGRKPWWKRLLGRKNIVQGLIEKAGGITVIVLDTRDYPSVTARNPLEIQLPGKGKDGGGKPKRNVPSGRLHVLSRLLSRQRIVIWNGCLLPLWRFRVLSRHVNDSVGMPNAGA